MGLLITDAGLVVMQQADQLFQLVKNLPARVRDGASATVVRLVIELTDGPPKLVVNLLLSQVMHEPICACCAMRTPLTTCRDLELHRLDNVL